ncbi:hypothetical protein FPCIR_8153 [Fusarium pseudocircinatum]|uniref:Uncharacterized protein n=1 Tax=Fusarium pseudocircinatum TaxID=56676 RepID=A0A8H5L722_9HYPO|nr:hypothetical protein FPCIR_8153 [Fusarium pseudocircinatum]
MSISNTVLPSIEDPNILTKFPSPGHRPSNREMIHSPEMQQVLDKFSSIDIGIVLDIQAKRIRESTQRISERPTSRSGWFCRKRGLRNLFKDIAAIPRRRSTKISVSVETPASAKGINTRWNGSRRGVATL